MTCKECQPLAIDLARGLPPFGVGGAVQRADVLSHVATCKRCAQWLSEQEALSDALRAAAEADDSVVAPASVEAKVMAAFRARQVKQPLSVARGESTAWRPAWPAGLSAGFAAAAIIVIAVLTMASLRWLNASTPTPSNDGVNSMAGASTPSGSPSTAAPSGGQVGQSTGAPVTGTNAAVIEVLPDKGRKTPKGRPTPPVRTPHIASAQGFAPSHAIGGTAGTGHGTTTRASNVARAASEFSGAAFVLLPYVEPLRPTEMRHIMRVRMTKAQFAAAELQTAGVDDATVLADVLVGEDGTARAVRIVQ